MVPFSGELVTWSPSRGVGIQVLPIHPVDGGMIRCVVPQGDRVGLIDLPLRDGEVTPVEEDRAPRLWTQVAAAFQGGDVQITYTDTKGAFSTRWVRPLAVFFMGSRAAIHAWCHEKGAKRSFFADSLTIHGTRPRIAVPALDAPPAEVAGE